jgi:stage IV sporulation protein A
MDFLQNNTYDLYKDIQLRTGGEIYLGVVGPVRTGKSTFIKRFMNLLVLPFMEDENEKERAQDEMPQSAGGRTVTTTEPKFIPKEAAHIRLGTDIDVDIRLIDCVGYMVEGATGHMEEDVERMVKTPWSAEEIPFTRAAEIGTRKVIKDHSTIGIVVRRFFWRPWEGQFSGGRVTHDHGAAGAGETFYRAAQFREALCGGYQDAGG